MAGTSGFLSRGSLIVPGTRGAWDARPVLEDLEVAAAAISQRKRDAAVRRHPSEKVKCAVRKWLRARFPKRLGASRWLNELGIENPLVDHARRATKTS